MKKVIAEILLGSLLLSGCSNIGDSIRLEDEAKTADSVADDISADESSQDDAAKGDSSQDDTKDDTKDDNSGADKISEDDSTKDQKEVDYNVFELFFEEIEEVPVSVVKEAHLDNGDVYTYNISYDYDGPERDYDGHDRFFLGAFYITDEECYVTFKKSAVYEEDDFYNDGILLYSEDDYSNSDSKYDISLHNDGYICTCSIYDNTAESGFYFEFAFNKDKELVYYRSGYGAEGDPIEIALPGEGIDDILGTEDEKSLTLEALTLDYEGVSITPKTTYFDIVDALGYPYNFEDNNNGFISSENGYRWQLNYPDASEYEADLRVVCVSPSMEFESDDTYIDFIYVGIPLESGIDCGDSIYTLADLYGNPTKIRQAEYYEKYTEVVYDVDGNKLIFTILPDMTIFNIKIDYKN